jgi:hypothetical protein
MRPWTAQHNGLQRHKVTHDRTERKRPASTRIRSQRGVFGVWQVLGSNQRRLSRRFYSTLAPPEPPPAEQCIRRLRRACAPPPSAMCPCPRHQGGPSHGQPRTPSAEPPDLRKPAGRTLYPKRIQPGRTCAGARRTNHPPAAAITLDRHGPGIIRRQRVPSSGPLRCPRTAPDKSGARQTALPPLDANLRIDTIRNHEVNDNACWPALHSGMVRPVTADLSRQELYIDGLWPPPVEGETLPVTSPVTEQAIGSAPRAGVKDIDRAVDAARRAFDSGEWPRTAPAERGQLLAAVCARYQQRAEEMAQTITAEMGSPITLARSAQVGVLYSPSSTTQTWWPRTPSGSCAAPRLARLWSNATRWAWLLPSFHGISRRRPS